MACYDPKKGSAAAGLVGACAVAVTVSAQFPVSAHPHPSGSTDRVTPGVVRVEASAKVDITLLDDRAQLRRVSRQYTVPLGAGSGFTVAPEGVIVTATGVVQPADDPRVYAANRIVAEYFEHEVPDDFARHQVGDAEVDARLQSCYPPYDTGSACLVQVTPAVTVLPNTDPALSRGLPVSVVRTGQTPQAPTVLRAAQGTGNTLPTVPVAAATPKNVTALNIVAYTGRPTAGQAPLAQTAHFEPAGSRTFKREDRERLSGLLDRDANGGALIDNAKSDVIAMMTADADGRLTATPVEDIRSALTQAGVTVRRGPVDVVYETALAHYHTRDYGGSVPILQQVLKLRPDHAVAAEHLRTAMARRGTAQDTGTKASRQESDGGGIGIGLWPVAGVLALAGAAAGALFLMRRAEPAGPAASPHGSSAGGSARPPGGDPRDEALRPWASGSSGTGGEPPSAAEAAIHRGEATALDDPHARAETPARPETPRADAPGRPDAGTEERAGPQERFCTSCGMRLGPGHQFCGFCGHPVDR